MFFVFFIVHNKRFMFNTSIEMDVKKQNTPPKKTKPKSKTKTKKYLISYKHNENFSDWLIWTDWYDK